MTKKHMRKLALVLALGLTGSALWTVPESAASTCTPPWPNTAFPFTVTVYYSDASYSTVVCLQDECYGSWCDPTPYYTTYTYCCTPP